MPSAFKIFMEGLAKARVSEEYSDCKLICGTHKFKLHKIILMTQSEYFRSAFKKGAFKEGKNGTIELKAIQSGSEASEEADDSCDDPEIVKLMVDFFYHLDYLPLPEVEATTSPSDSETEIEFDHSGPSERRRVVKKKVQVGFLDGESLTTIASEAPAPETAPVSVAAPQPVYIIQHAKVFGIAVKYQVDGLRDLAAMKFKRSVRASWDHDDFAHAISIVSNSTADNVSQLRDITIDVIHDHFDALKHKAEFESAVTGIPALAYALLKRVGTISGCTNGHRGEGGTKFCMGCYTKFDICAACKKCPLCKKILDGLGTSARD